MNKPKVSVIVPIYNTERYLEKCLDSLINQTLTDIEIVLINDGSRDSSAQIIKRYCDKYQDKIVFFSQKNSGQAVARNRGIEVCTGEYIGFLDSDDEAIPEMFEKMYSAAVESNADMVACDYIFVTDKKRQKKYIKEFKDKSSLLVDVFVDPWNKLYKSEILKNNGVRFPEGYYYEDTGWYACTVPFLNICVKVNDFLVLHYKREGSSMTALDDNRVSHIFPVLNSVLFFYKERNQFEKFNVELEYFYSKILLCSSMVRISRVKNREIRSQLVDDTFTELEKNFPEYKKNPYFQGRNVGKYINIISKRNATLFLMIFSVVNALKELKER